MNDFENGGLNFLDLCTLNNTDLSSFSKSPVLFGMSYSSIFFQNWPG